MHGPTLLLAVLICTGCSDSASTQQQSDPRVDAPSPELTVGEAAQIPPPPPFQVQLQIEGRKATITWQPSPLENIVSYRVYRRDRSTKRVRVGETNDARFVDAKATSGTEYTVTAVNTYGAESPHAVATVRSKD
jgi:fibronectin type 3 domain-containing protein